MQVSANRISAVIPVTKEVFHHNESRLAASAFEKRRARNKRAKASRKRNR